MLIAVLFVRAKPGNPNFYQRVNDRRHYYILLHIDKLVIVCLYSGTLLSKEKHQKIHDYLVESLKHAKAKF